MHNITTMYACVYAHMYSISSMYNMHIYVYMLCCMYVLYNTTSKFGATDVKGDDDAVNRDWED